MTITLSGTLTLDIGKGIVAAVELHRLHESVIAHCLTKGFDPILRDCHANATLDDAGGDEAKQKEMAQAMFAKKIASLYDGTARIRGERRESLPSDPIAAEAEREARVTIQSKAKKLGAAWYKAVGAALALPFATEPEMQALRAAAIKARAAKPEMIEAARKIVEARKDIAVSAEDLGL